MSLERAFLDDIIAHPADDAPRLVYADWLEERGDQASRDRAEFIRGQIELEGLPELSPRRWELERREAALLAAYRAEWWGPLPPLVRAAVFRRGFIDHVIVTLPDLTENAERLFALAPIRRVQVVGDQSAGVNRTVREARAAVRARGLRPVIGLDLGVPVARKTAEVLARADALANLRELHLHHGDRLLQGFAALLSARFVPGLRELWLNGGACQEALDTLPTAVPLAGLQVLSLRGLGPAAPPRLAVGPLLPGLQRLDLTFFAHPALTADGLHDALSGPLARGAEEVRVSLPGSGSQVSYWFGDAPASALRWLDLSHHGFLLECAGGLANSPSLAGLEYLNLRGNVLKSAGLAALARSPHLTRLRALLLHFNGIGDEGVIELARSPAMANLQWLDLAANRLTDRAAFALARSPILSNLARLSLQRNDVSERGRQALVDRFGPGVTF
jgi:uncharacterized protein (TIGR02996 family)